MNNPALREESRHRPAGVIPLQQEASILNWLEKTGRLLARDAQDDKYVRDEEEITELMGVEDSVYGVIDDDDDDIGGLGDDE